MATLTKHDVLLWGLKHIARNRNLNADQEELFSGVSHYILNFNGISVPLLNDTKMLAEDLGLADQFDNSVFGVEIFVSNEWKNTIGQEPYTNPNPFWKRYDTPIGSEL